MRLESTAPAMSAARRVKASRPWFAATGSQHPAAVGLGYVAVASRADVSKFKNYAAGQLCSNCALYAGKAGEAQGPCPLFAGKHVMAAGWCSAYVKKAG